MNDIDELERLARAATPGPHHIYTHPRDDNNWQANNAWHEAASPQVFMELIERVRAADADLFAARQALITEGMARDRNERMFFAACSELGLINEHLKLDPNDGGCDPIIGAIEEIEADRDRLAAQNAELVAAQAEIDRQIGYAGYNIGGPMAVLGENTTEMQRAEY